MTSTLHIPAGYLTLGLNSAGAVVELIDSRNGRNCISPGKSSALVSLVIDTRQIVPTMVRWSAADSTYTFANDTYLGFELDLHVLQKNGYTTFEVTRVITRATAADVQTLLWGPLPIAIQQTIGEVAGIVRDDAFAIGLKPLNDRTEGAWPKEYPQYGWESEVNPNPYKLDVAQMEPWSVAAQTSWGAVLRAFTFDYTRQRDRLNPNGYPIPLGPLSHGGSVIGSKIALYGCKPDLVTTILSFIAADEKLPYPTQNGQWQKVAQASSQSFLVLSDLDVDTVGDAARFANSAGINYIYSLPINYVGPWEYTGHYQFDSSFGGSDNEAAKLVAIAKELGVHVGVHTISDFISVGEHAAIDPYVAPPADPRLALGEQAALTRPLSASSTVLYLNGSAPLLNGIYGKMLRIGNEFISYTDSQNIRTEWEVSGLSRGQWGSVASSAKPGTPAARVILNSYDGAIGGLGIIDEIAARLGAIRNNVGIRAHSFDGVESAGESGWGSFGIARLINGTYAAQSGHDGYISETSRMTSNAWDTLTRASWGDAMTQLFLDNDFYRANYLPGMLGWINIDGASLANLEWTLARAAGLNAGIGFQTTVASLEQSSTMLDKIKQWETARNLGAFTEAQTAAFRDQSTYWSLSVVRPGQNWSLQQLDANGNAIGNPQFVQAPTPKLGPAFLPPATLGQLYETKITSNTPATTRFTVTSGMFPPGLRLNQDTGGIVGIPEHADSYHFIVTATNVGGLARAMMDYTIWVR